jgi:hypothetical protein
LAKWHALLNFFLKAVPVNDEFTEQRLRNQVIDAVRALGFTATRKQNLAFEELEGELARGLYPIVYVEALLLPSRPPQKHAIVIIGIRENEVQVLDPVRGEFVFLIEDFLREWNAMRRLAILIK